MAYIFSTNQDVVDTIASVVNTAEYPSPDAISTQRYAEVEKHPSQDIWAFIADDKVYEYLEAIVTAVLGTNDVGFRGEVSGAGFRLRAGLATEVVLTLPKGRYQGETLTLGEKDEGWFADEA